MLTERLLLRPHSLADLDDRAALVGDEQVMRHVGGAQDAEENWTRLLRYAGHWALRGFGLFAVEEKESGRLAGEVGLAGFHRGLGRDFDEAPEAAWVLAGWAQGRGYATEAMRAAIGWHETHVARERMVCVIAQDNAGSLRVARKLGFRIFGERAYRGASRLVLERAPRR